MPTGIKNNKSVKVQVRVPNEIAISIHLTKEDGESVSGYVNTAIEAEVNNRLKKIAKERGIAPSKIRSVLQEEMFSLKEVK